MVEPIINIINIQIRWGVFVRPRRHNFISSTKTTWILKRHIPFADCGPNPRYYFIEIWKYLFYLLQIETTRSLLGATKRANGRIKTTNCINETENRDFGYWPIRLLFESIWQHSRKFNRFFQIQCPIQVWTRKWCRLAIWRQANSSFLVKLILITKSKYSLKHFLAPFLCSPKFNPRPPHIRQIYAQIFAAYFQKKK